MAGLSPKIVVVEVGVREVREEKLYPLSMADQLALPDQIIEAISKMGKLDAKELAISTAKRLGGGKAELQTEKEDKDKAELQTEKEDKDMATIKIVMDMIVKNIDYILSKSMDNVTMADVTNEQFVDIVDAIFTVNYESTVGKLMDLAQRVKKLFRQPETKEAPGQETKEAPGQEA